MVTSLGGNILADSEEGVLDTVADGTFSGKALLWVNGLGVLVVVGPLDFLVLLDLSPWFEVT